MARIRTIKPEFFRDETLQDLESAHPRCYPMLVFAGLWGHCDKNGTFEWKPRNLKLDILPFLPFNMEQTLEVLNKSGLIVRFETGGKQFGHIPNFQKHQRINGREAQEEARYPEVSNAEQLGKQQGSIEEAARNKSGRQEGKGREGNSSGASAPLPFELPDWVPKAEWAAWEELRRKSRHPLTDHARRLAVAELEKLRAAGHAPALVINEAVLKGWRSFYPPKVQGPVAASENPIYADMGLR